MQQQGDLQEAYRYCDQIARRRARNFYPAFHFLSRPRRLALSAFYAFCTFSDDIADEDTGLSEADKRGKLTEWRESLTRCFNGQTDSRIFTALQDAIIRFELPDQPFYDLIKGIEMDLVPKHYTTFDELIIYCRNVASTVGLISVRIFGCRSTEADHYADSLGIAFQLTNIMRDLVEDLKKQRVYLPKEDLVRFSYSVDDLQNNVYDDRFLNLMNFQYNRALKYFDQADPGLVNGEAKKLLPAEIMKGVYRQTLEELKRKNFRIFDERISIPRWRLFGSVVSTLFKHLIP